MARLQTQARLKEGDLARAQRLYAEVQEGTLSALLVRMGLVAERDMLDAWAVESGVPRFDPATLPALPPAGIELPLRFLKAHRVAPLGLRDDRLDLLIADPADAFPLQAVRLATGFAVNPVLGLGSEVEDLLERWYGSGRSALGAIVDTVETPRGAADDDIEHLRDLASEAPVIRLVNLLIQRAVEQRASDIHIEPFENRLKVRYRVDGVLHEVEAPPASSAAAVISRVKIMVRLNIAERRLPQDGRIMLIRPASAARRCRRPRWC